MRKPDPQESVTVSNAELVTVRETMRALNRMIAQLESGEREQFVLLRKGRMVARLSRIDGQSQEAR